MTLWVSAVLAGVVAVMVTVAIERLGGVKGGFIGTLPSTIVPASFGMAATMDDSGLATALCSVAPGMLLNAGFLWLWRILPPLLPDRPLAVQLAIMVGASLGVWSVLAMGLVLGSRALLEIGLPPLVIGASGVLAIVAFGVSACWSGIPAPKGRNLVSPTVLLGRGVLAATAVGCSIALAQLGWPLLAGVASVFPAIYLTTMVSIWWSQGQAVSGGAIGPMMLGSASVATYAVMAAALFPVVGPGPGAVLAWLSAAIGVTLPATYWVSNQTVRDGGSTP